MATASGIGLAAVKAFLDEGANVVTDETQVEALVAETVSRFGRLDVMFDNAGAGGDAAALTDLTAEGLDKTQALLVRSVVLGHKYAARQFQAQGGGGAIISTSNAAALQGRWGNTSYTIS